MSSVKEAQADLLQKIKNQAIKDQDKRDDIRYLQTMAWMVGKGFLESNESFKQWRKGKLNLNAAIWAGENLEPRILEVLPAAVTRFPKEYDKPTECKKTSELFACVESLNNHKNKKLSKPNFLWVEHKKYKLWMELELNDKRTKPKSKIKKMCSFRLSTQAIEKLKNYQKETGLSGSEVLELLL